MKKILYPGTFDPPTLGHLDIIKRSAKLCDLLIIGVATNITKKPLFSIEKRIEFLKTLTKDLVVKIEYIPGLIADYVKKNSIDCLVRSVRSSQDFDYEMAHADINRKLANIDTLFLAIKPEYAFIRSFLIREAAAMGSRLHPFIPATIEEEIFQQLKNISSK